MRFEALVASLMSTIAGRLLQPEYLVLNDVVARVPFHGTAASLLVLVAQLWLVATCAQVRMLLDESFVPTLKQVHLRIENLTCWHVNPPV